MGSAWLKNPGFCCHQDSIISSCSWLPHCSPGQLDTSYGAGLISSSFDAIPDWGSSWCVYCKIHAIQWLLFDHFQLEGGKKEKKKKVEGQQKVFRASLKWNHVGRHQGLALPNWFISFLSLLLLENHQCPKASQSQVSRCIVETGSRHICSCSHVIFSPECARQPRSMAK